MKSLDAAIWSKIANLNWQTEKDSHKLWICVEKQKMWHLYEQKLVSVYTISTAKLGVGCKEGSFQTPIGLHQVAEKHGTGVPLGGILKSREFTGEIATILQMPTEDETDYITSRLLWLQGKEVGLNQGENQDSYLRYIYIHGTPQEGNLGTPCSHGCIRMKNQEIIELYDKIPVGTEVWITEK